MGRRRTGGANSQLARLAQQSHNERVAAQMSAAANAPQRLSLREHLARRPRITKADPLQSSFTQAALSHERGEVSTRMKDLCARLGYGGIPPSWINRKPRSRGEMVRDPTTRCWTRVSVRSHNEDIGPGENAGGDRCLTLEQLAIQSLAKEVARRHLDGEDLHRLLTLLPPSTRLGFVNAMFAQHEWSPRSSGSIELSLPTEALLILRSFNPGSYLELSFLPLTRANLAQLLSTKFSDTKCSYEQKHANDNVSDDTEATWESLDFAVSCRLHEFQLGYLQNLDLSFCSTLDAGTENIGELLARSLPHLRGLYVAGCFGYENGILTLRNIMRLLDLAVLDVSHNLLVSFSELRLLSSRSGVLPNLHTLYIQGCPLIEAHCAHEWHRHEYRRLKQMYV